MLSQSSPQKQTKSKSSEITNIGKQKRDKKKALQNFLQNSVTLPTKDLTSGNHSDQDQKTTQTQKISCLICRIQLDQYSKNCGFCNQIFCQDHLRKRRKNKLNNKFQRICDRCQDKYLFNKHMKLQLKIQQSLHIQQMIVSSKRQQKSMQLNGRQTKLKLLKHDQYQILQQKKQFQTKFYKLENQVNIKFDKLQKKNLQLKKLQRQISQLQIKLPPSFQEDFNALEQQKAKLNQQLVKYQKLCNEAIKTKSNKQKQTYEHYIEWQKLQKQNKNKKQEQCIIF